MNFNISSNFLEIVARHIPFSPIILEAGAHKGYDTVKLKSIFPDSIIYAFEPFPSNFKHLANSTKNFKDIYCYNSALGDKNGKVTFYVIPSNDGACSIQPPVGFNKYLFKPKPIFVNCMTLNLWASKHNVDHIDFMWLDMEGYELRALQNSTKILSTVKAIYTEVNHVQIRQGACLYKDIKRFLEQNGFKEVYKRRENKIQSNVLFVRKV